MASPGLNELMNKTLCVECICNRYVLQKQITSLLYNETCEMDYMATRDI